MVSLDRPTHGQCFTNPSVLDKTQRFPLMLLAEGWSYPLLGHDEVPRVLHTGTVVILARGVTVMPWREELSVPHLDKAPASAPR